MAELGLDLTQIVERIKALLDGAAESGSVDQGVVNSAAQFASHCARANDRLLSCQTRLRQGQRSEAMRMAEAEPKLLEYVTLLSSVPEEEWRAKCLEMGLPPAPRLAMAVASELNEAYDLETRVQPILQVMRRANLARASLRVRLQLLRQLLEIEPTYTAGTTDLADFERARIIEIEHELAHPQRDLSQDQLRAFHQELVEEDWKVEVPRALLMKVESRLRARIQLDAMPRLGRMLEDLDEAYAAQDFGSCRDLLVQWDQLVHDSQCPVPAEWARRIEPVRSWVDQLQRHHDLRGAFARALGELQQSLDSPKTSLALQAQRRKLNELAESLMEPIPDALDQRYRAVVARQELVEQRRGRMVAAGILILVGALAAGTVFVVQRGIRASRVQQWRMQISTAIEHGKVVEAGTIWQNLMEREPDLASDPQLAAEKGRLDQAEADEQRRLAQFQGRMTEAEKLSAANPLLSRALESPQLFAAHASELDQSLQQAGAALAEASQLAKSQDEQLLVTNFDTRLKQWRNAWQAGVEQPFVEKMHEATRALGQLQPTALESDPQGFMRQLDGVSELIRNMQAMPFVSDTTRQLLAPMQQQISGYHVAVQRHTEALQRAREQVLALQSIRATSIDHLVADLEQYAAKYPSSPRADMFRKAIVSADVWRSVAAWDPGLVSRWSQPAPRNTDDLTARLAAIQEYLAKYPDSILGEPVKRYGDYLARAVDALPVWKNEFFGTVLTNPLITDPEMVTVETPAREVLRYFVINGGEFREERIGDVAYPTTFRAILTPDLRGGEPKSFDPRRGFKVAKPCPSPQSLLAAETTTRLASLNLATWPYFGLDVARVISGHSETDSILRVTLLEIVFEMITKNGWGLDQEAEQLLLQLKSLRADRLNWINPEDPSTRRERVKAAKVIETSFGPRQLDELQALARQRLDEMWRSASIGCSSYGLLLKDDQGRWTLAGTRAGPGSTNTLRILGHAPFSGRMELRTIGTVENDQVELNPQAIGDAPEGTLVFVCRAS